MRPAARALSRGEICIDRGKNSEGAWRLSTLEGATLAYRSFLLMLIQIIALVAGEATRRVVVEPVLPRAEVRVTRGSHISPSRHTRMVVSSQATADSLCRRSSAWPRNDACCVFGASEGSSAGLLSLYRSG